MDMYFRTFNYFLGLKYRWQISTGLDEHKFLNIPFEYGGNLTRF